MTESLGRGGGELIEVAMAAVAAATRSTGDAGRRLTAQPGPPAVPARAPAPGADDGTVDGWSPRAEKAGPMLIHGATLLDGRMVDIRVGARSPRSASDWRRAGRGCAVRGGGTVLPGLHDHHVHVRSAAAAGFVLRRTAAGPHQRSTGTTVVERHARPRRVDPCGRVSRSRSPVTLDRPILMTVAYRHVPVRIQHRSGALWMLNSAALGRVGMAEHPDGRLRSADPGWSTRCSGAKPPGELSGRITATGVTGVTDATPGYGAR